MLSVSFGSAFMRRGYLLEKVLEIMQDEAGKSEYDSEVRIVRFTLLG